MKSESEKKSIKKSKNVLEEKRKIVKRKICIKKTNTKIVSGEPENSNDRNPSNPTIKHRRIDASCASHRKYSNLLKKHISQEKNKPTDVGRIGPKTSASYNLLQLVSIQKGGGEVAWRRGQKSSQGFE